MQNIFIVCVLTLMKLINNLTIPFIKNQTISHNNSLHLLKQRVKSSKNPL